MLKPQFSPAEGALRGSCGVIGTEMEASARTLDARRALLAALDSKHLSPVGGGDHQDRGFAKGHVEVG